jgi:hypothetical protein
MGTRQVCVPCSGVVGAGARKRDITAQVHSTQGQEPNTVHSALCAVHALRRTPHTFGQTSALCGGGETGDINFSFSTTS